jgi:hypothetical protein
MFNTTNVEIFVQQGSDKIALVRNFDSSGSEREVFNGSTIFVADGNNITIDVSTIDGSMLGNNTIEESWLMLEELPHHIETNEW